MTLPRTLEPEVMDTRAEAVDYDAMDHGEVNRVFVDDFLRAVQTAESVRLVDPSDRVAGAGPKGCPGVAPTGASQSLQPRPPDEFEDSQMHVLDCGTGTAQIPVELCRRNDRFHVTAVDLAREMLIVAERNVQQAGLERQITLQHADSKRLPFDDGGFDAVMSNSIVHHIPRPLDALREMVRVSRPGGVLFVRDLLRPPEIETVDRLVETYAGDANAHQQKMFRDSLCAALTLDEVGELLTAIGLPADWATQTTDRHWTIAGVVPR